MSTLLRGTANAANATNWREYIAARFAKHEGFSIHEYEDSTVISDVTGRSQTEIDVRYMDSSAHELWGVYYFNPRTPLWNMYWSGESTWCELADEDRVFSERNVESVEEQLKVPLQRGWAERLYYYKGEHVKSRLVWIYDVDPIELTVYVDQRGCLLSPYQAVRYSSSVAGSRMRVETVIVRGMDEGA